MLDVRLDKIFVGVIFSPRNESSRFNRGNSTDWATGATPNFADKTFTAIGQISKVEPVRRPSEVPVLSHRAFNPVSA